MFSQEKFQNTCEAVPDRGGSAWDSCGVEPAPEGIELRGSNMDIDLLTVFRRTPVEAAAGPVAGQRRVYRGGVLWMVRASWRPHHASCIGGGASEDSAEM
jgi:hypothetical protein